MAINMMLYRSPGSHPAPGGLTYDYVVAPEQEDVDRLSKGGWSLTLDEALGRAKPAIVAADDDQMTPEDRSKSAAETLSAAADAALAANTVLETDTRAKESAEKELANAEAQVRDAEAGRVDAESKVYAAEAVRSGAANKFRTRLESYRASSVRATAAAKALSLAADNVIAADNRMDAVEAAKRALSAAAGTAPAQSAPPPPAQAAKPESSRGRK
ncbi:MAG: hypothetical protein WC986_13620 [Elusimicrobiota bacterium]|jgi:hypothetical protein